MGSPREDFTFEYIYTTFFHEGEVSPAYPFVEVFWFERGQEVRDTVARVVTKQVKEIVGEDNNVAVIFTTLEPSAYYDNAKHY